MRHNSLRDTFAELLQNAKCKDVVVEPTLLPLKGAQLPSGASTEDGARLDVSARSLWCPLERAFLDIRVFHALAPTNKARGTPAKMYAAHENEKKRKYNARVLQIEHGTFTPVVFSTTGGAGKEAQALLKRIAVLTANKTGQEYADVMNFVRRRVRFDLLRTTIIALRGSRKKKTPPADDIRDIDMNLIKRMGDDEE